LLNSAATRQLSVVAPPLPTACPPWCSDHIDARSGGVLVHQHHIGRAVGLEVNVWQGEDGLVTVELLDGDQGEVWQVPAASVRALARLFGAAAVIVASGRHRKEA
jgi:hypothetical protein